MTSKQPSTTTQIQKVELPAWVDKASQENYKEASALGSQPFMQYQGNRVGEMGADTQTAINNTKTAIGSGDMSGILADIASGKTNAADLMKNYQNPYQDDVINKTLSSQNDQRIQALMGNSDAASAAGAFGGSRHGVVDAVTNSESLKNMGLLESQMRSQGFNTALGAAQNDVAGRASSATAATDARTKSLAGLLQTGLTEQQTNQAKIDADMTKFNEPRQNDIDNLNLKLSALGMSPYGKTDTTTKTSTGGSSGTDFGQMGMGIFSLLLGLSEDDTKTDKEKVGMVPGTDLELWAYRYKKDPKTYPKVVGVMASDVEKKMPEAVHKVDGKRIINYGLIGEVMANGGK
jgi:hypothetical protein